jgi:transcriptional regulator of aromatic amino acid metabolism
MHISLLLTIRLIRLWWECTVLKVGNDSERHLITSCICANSHYILMFSYLYLSVI